MRPVTTTDLAAAARVLLHAPPAARPAQAAALIQRAHCADRYRQLTGRLHPRFGTGTLLSAALTCPLADPTAPGDPEYLACLAQMLETVIAWSATRNRR